MIVRTSWWLNLPHLPIGLLPLPVTIKQPVVMIPGDESILIYTAEPLNSAQHPIDT